MLRKSSERSDSCWAICGTKASRGKLLLVAEVGIVLVEPAKISIVGGRGAEEDGRRQVVFARFEVLVHLTRDPRLDGHSVSLGTSRSHTHIDPGVIIFRRGTPPQAASLPTLRCLTAEPTFTTRPEASCPSTIGSLTTKSAILPCCQ